MRFIFQLLFILFLLPGYSQPVHSGWNYPETRKSDHVDIYHDVKVADPYNWLECDTCTEVTEWVKKQNKVTFSYLEKIPFRDKIKKRLTEIWSFASMSAPSKKKKRIFYYKNNGKQNHSVFYMKNEEGEEKILIDPNTMSMDGTTSLNSAVVSHDAKYVAYSISKKGSDWNEIFILDIDKNVVLRDHLKWIKFSGISWKNNGFFYSRYDAPSDGSEYSAKNTFHKVYYHIIGTSQEKDQLVFEDKNNPLRTIGCTATANGKHAILSISEGTSGNAFSIADIAAWKPGEKIVFTEIVKTFESDYSFVSVTDAGLLFLTNNNAPNKKIICISPKKTDKKSWKTIVDEKPHVLESAHITSGKMVLKYLENVSSKLYLHALDGKLIKEIKLPVIGMVSGINTGKDDPVIYYSMVSYCFPQRIYKYHINSDSTEVYFKPDIDFDSDNFETKQVFYAGKDGTKIPMFITHKKGLKIDGNNPLFLFGYGGFNISYTPEFRVDRSVFLENDGIYCVANIRGGGEFGEKWHKAGTQLNKQNVFDDFIAAAEYLIKEGYTNKNKIAIHGRSNGGLLAGACLTQRPDLYKCVIPQVGVLDMLKFHKFTIGWAWKGDYGSSEDEKQFEYLLKYSPVHNVKKDTKYPATLIVTGDHDDRVVPAHSFKFIAELQEKQSGEAPVLIRIDTGGGHGSGKPLSMQIEEYSDMWSFVFYQLGMDVKEKDK